MIKIKLVPVDTRMGTCITNRERFFTITKNSCVKYENSTEVHVNANNLLLAWLSLRFDCHANFDREFKNHAKNINGMIVKKIFILSGYLNIKDATLSEK